MALNLTGLEEVINSSEASSAMGKPLLVKYSSIIPDPDQPRKKFNQKSLNELAQSIKENGLLQPIVVKRLPNGQFKIKQGERRWRACGILKLEEVPVFVEDEYEGEGENETQNFIHQMVENIQRADLFPWETALGVAKLIAKGLKQKDIVEKLGKDKTWVSRHVTISNAPAELKKFSERILDYTALYDLVRTFSTHKKETLSYLDSLDNQAEIGRKEVSSFLASIKIPDADKSISNFNSPKMALTIDEAENTTSNSIANTDESTLTHSIKEQTISSNKESDFSAKQDSQAASMPYVKTKISTDNIFRVIYKLQATGDTPISTILDTLSDDERMKVFKILAEEHKQGANTDSANIDVTISKRFSDGLFSVEDAGLYSFFAFLTGATSKEELNMEKICTKCFTAAEIIIKG